MIIYQCSALRGLLSPVFPRVCTDEMNSPSPDKTVPPVDRYQRLEAHRNEEGPIERKRYEGA